MLSATPPPQDTLQAAKGADAILPRSHRILSMTPCSSRTRGLLAIRKELNSCQYSSCTDFDAFETLVPLKPERIK